MERPAPHESIGEAPSAREQVNQGQLPRHKRERRQTEETSCATRRSAVSSIGTTAEVRGAAKTAGPAAFNNVALVRREVTMHGFHRFPAQRHSVSYSIWVEERVCPAVPLHPGLLAAERTSPFLAHDRS